MEALLEGAARAGRGRGLGCAEVPWGPQGWEARLTNFGCRAPAGARGRLRPADANLSGAGRSGRSQCASGARCPAAWRRRSNFARAADSTSDTASSNVRQPVFTTRS